MGSSGRTPHIVLDLEFNIVNDPQIRESIQQEIIEIGAVKVDAKGAPIDTFNSMVWREPRRGPSAPCSL